MFHKATVSSARPCPTPQNGAVKDDVPEDGIVLALPQSIPRLLRQSNQMGLQRPVHAKLVAALNVVVAKAAATAQVVTLAASGFQDFNTYAALYDEVTVQRGEVRIVFDSCAMGATASIGWALGYDPVDSATVSSYLSIAALRYSTGPMWQPLANGGVFNSAAVNYPGAALPAAVNGLGAFTLGFTGSLAGGKTALEKRPTVPTSGSTSHPGMWMSTSTSSLNFGYLKFYCSSPGSTNTGLVVLHTTLWLAFRTRST